MNNTANGPWSPRQQQGPTTHCNLNDVDGQKSLNFLDAAWKGKPWCPQRYKPPALEIGTVLRMVSLTKSCLKNNIPLECLWRPETGFLALAMEQTKSECLSSVVIEHAMPYVQEAKKASKASVPSKKPPSPRTRRQFVPYSVEQALEKPIYPYGPQPGPRPESCTPELARSITVPSKRKFDGDHEAAGASRLNINFLLNSTPPPAVRSTVPNFTEPGADAADISFLQRYWGKNDFIPKLYESPSGTDARQVKAMKEITELLVSRSLPLCLIWITSAESSGTAGNMRHLGLMVRCMERLRTKKMNQEVAHLALGELRAILSELDRKEQAKDKAVEQVTTVNKRTVVPETAPSGPAKIRCDFPASPPETRRPTPGEALPPSPQRVSHSPVLTNLEEIRMQEPTPVTLASLELSSDSPSTPAPPLFEKTPFDIAIYSQPGVDPPPDLAIPEMTWPPPSGPDWSHSGPSDLRLYFCHLEERSDTWYAEKQAEIKARGGRKTNFGRARERLAKRMAAGFRPKPLEDSIWEYTLLPEVRNDPETLSAFRCARRLHKAAARKAAESEQSLEEAENKSSSKAAHILAADEHDVPNARQERKKPGPRPRTLKASKQPERRTRAAAAEEKEKQENEGQLPDHASRPRPQRVEKVDKLPGNTDTDETRKSRSGRAATTSQNSTSQETNPPRRRRGRPKRVRP